MSELRELYQQVILDHNKQPRNFRALEGATHSANGHNPLCGDRIKVYAKVGNGLVEEATFEGTGCAISKASASMMTGVVKGKSLEEVARIFDNFHRLVTGDPKANTESLGKLAVFSGVCEFPARVKCASLAWHTLQAALTRAGSTISTEGSGAEDTVG